MVLIPKLDTWQAAKAVKSPSQLLNLPTQIQFNTVLLACFSNRFSDIMLDAMQRLLRSDYVPYLTVGSGRRVINYAGHSYSECEVRVYIGPSR